MSQAGSRPIGPPSARSRRHAGSDGSGDLVASQGRIAIVATVAEIDSAIAGSRPMAGYKWIG